MTGLGRGTCGHINHTGITTLGLPELCDYAGAPAANWTRPNSSPMKDDSTKSGGGGHSDPLSPHLSPAALDVHTKHPQGGQTGPFTCPGHTSVGCT